MAYAQIGTPVQFFQWDKKKKDWITNPGLISSLDNNKAWVNIQVFPASGRKAFIKKNVRHENFKKARQDYWDYIPDHHP